MTTYITKLTRPNTDALQEVFGEGWAGMLVTSTTATWREDPAAVAERINCYLAGTSGRNHPRASLWAVLRKVEALPAAAPNPSRRAGDEDNRANPDHPHYDPAGLAREQLSAQLWLGCTWSRDGLTGKVVELVAEGRYAVVFVPGSDYLLVRAATGELIGEWS